MNTGNRPPAWAVLGTVIAAPLFIGAIVLYIPYLLTGWRLARTWTGLRWIGAVLILFALPVTLDFLIRFVREGHGTPVPIAPPQRLVVSGAFRYVRNPGYLAALCAIVGQGLFGSVVVLVYGLGMWLLFHFLVVGYEEPVLRREFGAEYDAYRDQVPRWLPRWRNLMRVRSRGND